MSLLRSGPLEVVSRIFQSCEGFADVLALASTCKHLHSTWVAETKSIIWQVGSASILSFDEAIIAVRSTEIVRSAYANGTLPPEIDIPSLSGMSSKPTISELESVLDFHLLARYCEYRALLQNKSDYVWGSPTKYLLDETPDQLLAWKDNFHRAVYRHFIAGSVLVRFYLEPFFAAEEKYIPGADGFEFLFEAIDWFETQDDPETRAHNMPLSQEEEYYISQYPVFNFTPHPEWEKCFGHFGDWLVETTRNRVAQDSGDGLESVGLEVALKEVMQLLVMYGRTCDIAGGGLLGTCGEPVWSRHRPGPDGLCMCHQKRDLYTFPPSYWPRTKTPTEKVRRLPLVYLGECTPFELEISVDLLATDGPSFDISSLSPSPNAPSMPDIGDFTSALHCMSGRPNYINGHPAPHPPLHLFSFLLRKYFGYQFDELAFELNTPDPIYETFIGRGNVFTPDASDWEGMLTSLYPEQVLTYKELGWVEMRPDSDDEDD